MNKPGPILAKAVAAWGKPLPDWIRALAEACDKTSLRKTALEIEASPAYLSVAINNKREKLDWLQARVEKSLMGTTVQCPILDVIDKKRCLREQAKLFSSANPLRVKLYRACRNGCPHYREKRHAE